MKKFWNWKNKIVQNQDETSEKQERILFLNGTIAEESWFDDDVTPKIFKEELLADSGDITIWINSPGGDCIAAAQIYNMLMEYKGQVTVKIDGLAASAASVIAMTGKPAGDIIKNQSLDLGMLTIILSVALRHHKMRTPQWYAEKMQELVEEGIELETDIQIPVVKCIAGSGILGKAVYYKLFPEEMTDSASEELTAERKNARKGR